MSRPVPPLALLAGGLATRMRPITATIPKSMIPVAEKPFIAHQLDLLARNGVRDVVICCGFLGQQIEEFVGNGSSFGCSVRYSYDGFPLKGTGGALRRALPLLGDAFFVMYGDSYLPVKLQPVSDAFFLSQKSGLMTVYRNENRWDRSNVEFSQGRIIHYDKQNITPAMHYIDYGLGMLRSRVLSSRSEEDIFDLATVYRSLLSQDELAGYEVNTRFYEIGTPSGLEETDEFLKWQK